MRLSSQFPLLSLAAILWGLGACTAQADQSTPLAVQTIPGHFRREPLDRDYFYIESLEMLPASDWCVALLLHAVAPADKPDLFPSDFDLQIVGAVAVNVKSEKALHCKPTGGDDGAALAIVDVRPLANDACAVILAGPNAPEDREREIFSEEATVYEWDLPKGKLTRLGANMHVQGLAFALAGTQYRAIWPKSFRRSWDGNVMLTGADGRRGLTVKTVDTTFQARRDKRQSRRFPGSLDDLWPRKRQFAPGDDPHSLVVVHFHQSGDPANAVLLKWLHLIPTPAVSWRHTVGSVSEAVEGRISQIRLLPGAARPLEQLPILVERRDGSACLCRLDAENGRIRQVLAFADAPMFLAASHSGRYVALRPQVSGTAENKVVFVDVHSGETTAERVLSLDELGFAEPIPEDFTVPFITPLGFRQDKAVLLADAFNLWVLAAPYTGHPRLVFSLSRSSPTLR